MAQTTETSVIKQIKIPQISKLESIYTDEVELYRIPWNVHVFKSDSSLCAELICRNEDNSSDWSIAAGISCKLLPFCDDLGAIEGSQSNVFDRKRLCGVDLPLIEWNDLFNEEKNYVDNDTIKLELKIDAQNPNYPNKSVAKLWRDCDDDTKFLLNVKNVSSLLAVRAHPFKLNGLTWYVTVGKNKSSNHLFAHLNFDESTMKNSCDISWSLQLLSWKDGVDSIEKTEIDSLLSSDYYSVMENIVSWNDLFKPENGFLNNDAITMELEIKSIKPLQNGTNGIPTAKRIKEESISPPSSPSSTE